MKKLKRKLSMLMASIMGVTVLSGTFLTQQAFGAQSYKSFDFTSGYSAAPIYSESEGSGFVAKTSAMPPRELNTAGIKHNEEGFYITEDGTGKHLHNTNSSHYNYGGLVFRVDVDEAGAYGLTVELGNGATKSNTYVAPSGMQASRITSGAFWDSAKLVPIQHYAKWENDTTWKYDYVTGEKYIEFEIEPTEMPKAGSEKTVGVKKITIEKLPQNTAGDKPTVFVLGDSTEKTYTFEEAAMSGWGQIIGSMFDPAKVNVINYSMGGRSMKAMYTENRFNDVLLTAKPGDYVMIHSAHNDESTGDSAGPEARFGRGSNTETYTRWLNSIYIPAMLSRGINPILVTPMPRTNNGKPTAGFTPDSPKLMKEAAAANDKVEVVDLYENAKKYIDEVGQNQTIAIYMSIEAGESPGKTNSGSYANGHPDGKIDGTHYKEAAAKVWSKLIVEEINKNSKLSALAATLKDDVKAAISSVDWNTVFPEWTDDVTYAKSGDGKASSDPTYYRNQIEKLLQIGAMKKIDGNNFKPLEAIKTNDFISSLCAVWGLDLNDAATKAVFEPYFESGTLIREKMAAIILDAYELRFGKAADGSYNKPTYMTYNGTSITPDDPTYDPNLTGKEAQYYPLVGWGNLTDKKDISLEYAMDAYDVYNLGLMRSESGIARGSMINGTLFEPKAEVTRAKAAKELWFLWVLGQNNVLAENQITQITKDGSTYTDVVYTPIEYTAPAYEFSSVNIDSDGKLSVKLTKSQTAAAGKLSVTAGGETKTYDIAADGSVPTLDTVLATGEAAVLKVVDESGNILSAERKVECTQLIVPVRSYTASNVPGIKNGVIGLKNITAGTAEAASLGDSTNAALATDADTVEWMATKEVAKGEELLGGVCSLVPTINMTFTAENKTANGKTFTGYVTSGTNGYTDTTRDRSGFLFTPHSDGILTAYVRNPRNDKNFVIVENGKSESEAIAHTIEPGAATGLAGDQYITAPVEAEKTYYISVLGSKGSFRCVEFTPGAPVVSVLAKPGETVEITATPNEGYSVESVTANAGETPVSLTQVSQSVYTFEMPESDVLIDASFKEGGSVDPTPTPKPIDESAGDIDKNNVLTANDAAALLYYVKNNSMGINDWNVELENADVDGDGKLSETDAARILSKVLDSAYSYNEHKASAQ